MRVADKQGLSFARLPGWVWTYAGRVEAENWIALYEKERRT